VSKDDLRKRAESYLEARSHGAEPEVSGATAEDREALIQDLQVHQVELKLQNEELRDAYARLEESSQEYVDLFERAPMGLVVIDAAGIVRRCNDTFRQLIGSEGSECDRPLTDFVTDESAQVWRGRFRAFFTRPEEKQIDLELALPDRRRRVIRLVGQTIDAPPRPLRGATPRKGGVLMLVAFEVTDEIIAREQSRDLVAEKELLLREMRHRTQNHLVTIQSMLSFQAAHAGNSAVADALTGAGERIRAMLFVNEILTSRRGQDAVDLATYLSELLERIGQAQMALAGITVETDFTSLSVTADTAFTLGLIVNELVTNAFKYAFPPDREDKTVRVALRPVPDGRAELIVCDTGVGIDLIVAAAAGTPNHDAPSAGGSGGFGLHLVEGLVGQMDGTVAIENTGSGTCCRVEFDPGSATL
jgi:two-component sensor histidine kinase